MVKEVREYFRENYGHVNIAELSDAQIEKFVNRNVLEDMTFERKMDLLYDYILANGLAEVQE